ncbi:hypothetical protein B0H63DRAFT_152788 [Podospora didyma]|uniref:Uncharacterized protein n=1 Tax=Podospora didyma TaxID=330526 RepID=A0AAE0NTH2_9PEZI|nr:hypothetical protein B0H63DRAFT_152788 [Podospora didyma]
MSTASMSRQRAFTTLDPRRWPKIALFFAIAVPATLIFFYSHPYSYASFPASTIPGDAKSPPASDPSNLLIPSTDCPKTECPKTECPSIESLKTEFLKTECPTTECATIEAPKQECPKQECPSCLDRDSPLLRLQVFPMSNISADTVCDAEPSVDHHQKKTNHTATTDEIPNYVHYVWILKDPAVFKLNFKVFISVYAAYLHLKPERIYFHTDASPGLFEQAKVSGDEWTKRILSLPGITFNRITVPTHAANGVELTFLEHKSDFIRIEALRDFGGLYLDVDAIPLRDLRPLRRTGFANVLGGAVALSIENTGYINNGVLMAKPHSMLMNIWLAGAHRFHDGQWATSSILLLTDIAYRLSAVPSEVLVLHERAFAPTSWEYDDLKRFWLPNPDTPAAPSGPLPDEGGPREMSATCADAMAYLHERDRADDHEKWEMDFSATYVLHAFDNGVNELKGWDHEITLPYILARQSNYARAVYPIIWHAVEHGTIPQTELP